MGQLSDQVLLLQRRECAAGEPLHREMRSLRSPSMRKGSQAVARILLAAPCLAAS